MPLDINKMFSDMVGVPGEQDRLDGLARVEAMGQGSGMAALLSPQRSRALRQSMGGLFGVDTKNVKEKIPEILKGLDMTDPASIMDVARKLDEIGAGAEAAQLRNSAIQNIEDNRVRTAQTAAQTANAAANTSQAAETVRRTPAVLEEAAAATSRAATQAAQQKINAEAQTLAEATFDFDQEDSNRFRTIQEEQNRLEQLRINHMATNLTNQDKTLINEAVESSIQSQQEGMVAIQMAAKFERLNPLAGFRGDVIEGFHAFLGNQNEVSLMRTQFTGFVNNLVVQGLPPGVASDKDIEMVQSGFPDASYSPEMIQRYMRGLAKASFINAALESAKADYAMDNQGNLAGFQRHWKEISSAVDFISKLEEEHNINFIEEGEEDDIGDSPQAKARLILQQREAANPNQQRNTRGSRGGF